LIRIGQDTKTEGISRPPPPPVGWQEHPPNPRRDRVSISKEAREWEQGQWIEGAEGSEVDPMALANAVLNDPTFSKSASQLMKPGVSLRSMASRDSTSAPDVRSTDQPERLPGPQKPVDPRIAWASRHAPLEQMLAKPPTTMNVQGNLTLPNGMDLPLSASFEMGDSGMQSALFRAQLP